MGIIRKSKKDIVLDVQQKITTILSTLQKYECDAELYLCDINVAKQIQELDNLLFPLRSDTARGKAYDVNKLINIINPDEPAYDFSVVKVYKYQYIKDKERCLKKIGVQMEISHNFQKKSLKDLISSNNFSDDYIKKLWQDLEEKITCEKVIIDEILKNPDEFDILISGYKEKVEHEQVNYGVKKTIKKIKKGKEITLEKKRFNSHLSIKKPNLIVYHPDIEEDSQRSDMEVKYLEIKGFKLATRGVFYRKKYKG